MSITIRRVPQPLINFQRWSLYYQIVDHCFTIWDSHLTFLRYVARVWPKYIIANLWNRNDLLPKVWYRFSSNSKVWQQRSNEMSHKILTKSRTAYCFPTFCNWLAFLTLMISCLMGSRSSNWRQKLDSTHSITRTNVNWKHFMSNIFWAILIILTRAITSSTVTKVVKLIQIFRCQCNAPWSSPLDGLQSNA